MNLDAVRAHLRAAQDQITSGDAATAVATLDRTIDDLSPDRLLTPGEAAAAQGADGTGAENGFGPNGTDGATGSAPEDDATVEGEFREVGSER